MAKKLTPEQLEEIKQGDFGHYIPKDAPKKKTAAQKKAEAEAAVAISKHAGGRPLKGEDKLKVCSFRLRERDYRKIKAVAASRGKSAGDLLAEFIATLPDEIKL